MTRVWRRAIVVAGLLVAWVAWTEARQVRPEVELRRAMDLETLKGDVKGAMAQYEAIADRHRESNRAVTTQALLRLAGIHARQGSAEAAGLYARIVADFPEQLAAADARTRLAALSVAPDTQAGGSDGARALRMVYSGSFQARVSPDGRYLVHDDWPRTGTLFVRELATGRETSHPLSGFDVAFSRDSSELAYGRCESRNHCEVRVARVGTTDPPRTIFTTDLGYAGVMDWSPDGRSLAIFVSRRDDRILQFGFLRAATGAFSVVKTVDWGGANSGLFSPDGRDIAIDARVSEQGGKRDIVLMAVDASREVPLVTGPADEFVLGWTPDGKHLLYGSDSNGSIGVWALAIADRKPAGEPRLVAPNVGTDVSYAGFTDAGALYLGFRASTMTAEVVPVNLATGKRTGPASRPLQTVANSLTGPDWSPDGKSLVYFMSRHGELLVGTRSMDTGVEHEVKVGASLGLINSYVSWGPDGSFVTYGRDLKGRYGVFRIDAGDGRVTPLVFRGPDGRAGVEGFFWSPDGTKMYYRTATGGRGPIVEHDVASGTERTAVEGQFRSMSLSPDGRWFAVPVAGTLTLIPVAGGERRDLLTGGFVGAPEWTPDSQSVIVLRTPRPEAFEALLVPIDGGSPRAVDFHVPGFRINPDGRSIVYPAGEERAEVWALENFLPLLGAR